MQPETTDQVANNAMMKGDVLAAARIAGIQAAKRAAELTGKIEQLAATIPDNTVIE